MFHSSADEHIDENITTSKQIWCMSLENQYWTRGIFNGTSDITFSKKWTLEPKSDCDLLLFIAGVSMPYIRYNRNLAYAFLVPVLQLIDVYRNTVWC